MSAGTFFADNLTQYVNFLVPTASNGGVNTIFTYSEWPDKVLDTMQLTGLTANVNSGTAFPTFNASGTAAILLSETSDPTTKKACDLQVTSYPVATTGHGMFLGLTNSWPIYVKDVGAGNVRTISLVTNWGQTYTAFVAGTLKLVFKGRVSSSIFSIDKYN